MKRPLAIDLCAGLGGWTEGLIAEGWDVIGWDVERHKYGSHQYSAQLVLQDILTLNGRQFCGKVSLIVASPPCQEYSYMAMPWTRAKRIAQALYARKLCGRGPDFPDGYTGSRTVGELTALFDACLRIGREAGCPIVIENVRGAVPWVGRSRWHYGSYHLWGDVPALMPFTIPRVRKSKVGSWDPTRANFVGTNKHGAWDLDDSAFEDCGIKNSGGSWFNVAHNTESGTNNNPARGPKGGLVRHDPRYPHLDPNTSDSDGVKQGGDWFNSDALDKDGQQAIARRSGSKSSARKAASARIAKIPLPLARWIARTYLPTSASAR